MLIFGTLPRVCYAEGMTWYLYAKQVRIFDYAKFAEPLRDHLREKAEKLAGIAGIEIQFVRKRNVPTEELVSAALAKQGDYPGLGWILSLGAHQELTSSVRIVWTTSKTPFATWYGTARVASSPPP
jgi:hypothetical protein